MVLSDNGGDYLLGRLFELRDSDYLDFNSRLIPTVPKEKMIGVRTPELRRLAKEFSKTEFADAFLDSLPHNYYEENNIHAFMIENIRDYSECISRLNRFLPYVDNWATCDMMRPKVFKKHLPELLGSIGIWLASGETYTVRFGIEMLMTFYLDEHFSPEYPAMVAEVRSDEYYIKMMQAWYFATALAKQWDEAVKYIEQNRLDEDTHNKAIRKAVESYRITDEQKAYLRGLKR
ncbi:MAG: DNA alkylation repair protein [Acutalibacteraceae bacterium]